MRADLVVIQAERDRHFTVTGAGRRAYGFGWDEMLGAVASLTHPEIATIHPGMAGCGSEPAAQFVTLTMTAAEAEHVAAGMADLLCWVGGFTAARPDDHASHPMGVEATRALRLKLLSAINVAAGRPAETDLPF